MASWLQQKVTTTVTRITADIFTGYLFLVLSEKYDLFVKDCPVDPISVFTHFSEVTVAI